MGSKDQELVTAIEAAELLNTTERAVMRMAKKGLLSPVYLSPSERTKKYFRRTDIAAISALYYKELDLEKVANLAMRALALAENNERRLNEICTLLGLNGKPISFQEEDVMAFYLQAQDGLTAEILPTTEELMVWSRLFFQITEEYLRTVERFTADEEPWKVFLSLGQKYSEQAPRTLFPSSPPLESAYSRLELARRQLRTTAYFYLRSRSGAHAARNVFTDIGGGIDEVLINLLYMH